MLQPRAMAWLGAFAGAMVIVALTGFTFLDFHTGRIVHAEPGPMPAIDASLPDHGRFREAYDAKLANPAYIAFKNRSGLPSEFQAFPEELRVKEARARLARSLQAPAGVKPAAIPLINDPPPVIDGAFGYGEWEEAIHVPIGVNGARTTLLLMADRRRLYVACDAPQETTEDGYDQFRFYVHLGLTPLMVNERVHVERGSGPLGGIRQTTVRWRGAPAANDDERWKNAEINDWRIYRKAVGASAIDGHRRYEAALDLDETGLFVGVPFTGRVEVESDPRLDPGGGFRGRTLIGELGRPTSPVWFIIEDG